MAEWKFSSANDPRGAQHTRQFTLRHFFALVTICSVAAFGYTWFKRASAPTELLAAARIGDVDSLQQLVRSGVDIHYRDGWHTTALMVATSHGHTESVRFLIENGADPNERSRFNATPLICAAKSGRMAIVKYLIENGAVTSLTDENELTAADHARQNGFDELANFIDKKGAG